MIVRYLAILAGAFVITAGLLYFMQSVAVRLGGGDRTLYYLVNDFIPAPDRGRQRATPPPAPEAAPARPGLSAPDEPSVGATEPSAAGATGTEREDLQIQPLQPLGLLCDGNDFLKHHAHDRQFAA